MGHKFRKHVSGSCQPLENIWAGFMVLKLTALKYYKKPQLDCLSHFSEYCPAKISENIKSCRKAAPLAPLSPTVDGLRQQKPLFPPVRLAWQERAIPL